MSWNNAVAAPRATSALSTNKLIRNTYTLLAMTLLFSAAMAGVGMVVGIPYGFSMIASLVSLGLLWFVLPRTANSVTGIGVTFAITGLLGLGLGPILNMYLALPNGSQIVMSAMGLTGLIFLGLSAYALTSRRDFSFMAGFLFSGILIAFVLGLVVMGAGMFGYHLPGLALAVSAMFAVLMVGYILFQTSQIVNGGETNYIMATVGLYLSIYNLFLSLLQLLGAFSGDD